MSAVEIKNALVGEAMWFAADPPAEIVRTSVFGPLTRVAVGRYNAELIERFDTLRVLVKVVPRAGVPTFADGRVPGFAQDFIEINFWDSAGAPTDFIFFSLQLWSFPSGLEDLF